MAAILTVENIRKAFGSTVAVNDVSFSVEAGEIKGLLGPNGAGKTTAIRMIMGILAADQGTIHFDLPGGNGRIPKERIGYLPEERGLYYDAKVIENLLYLAQLKGRSPKETRAEAMQWLERLELGEWANHRLDKLSKGMQQKVQFIAALLHKPDLVMLDEPFSGLDPINQNFFKELIQELRDQGVTVLLSAHQMNLVEELCDSLAMIHRGRMVLSGTMRSIKDNYSERMLDIRYTGAADVERVVQQFPGMTLETQREERLLLRYDGPATVNDLVSGIAGWMDISECSVQKPPLHDIFVNTVKQQGGQIDETEMA